MLAVYPFCPKDADQLYDNLIWLGELGPQNHDALLVADPATTWDCCKTLLELACKCFRTAKLITADHAVDSWIAGANSLFRTAALACEGKVFWWNEPDCVPLKSDWLDRIERDYEQCRKPFMGALVKPEQPGFPSPYLEGCAVYPADCWKRIQPHWNEDKCWCFTTAPETVPNTFNTKLIHQLWGSRDLPVQFVDMKTSGSAAHDFTLENIHPHAVVFHRAKKDCGLIAVLRRRMFPDKPDYSNPPVFVQMGRFGDLILLMPAFKAWADRSGYKTIVVTTREFGNVLEGASYIQPIMLGGFTWFDVMKATRWAIGQYGNVVRTQLHGTNVDHKPDSLPSYSMSMWKRTGLMDEYMTLPLVFDQRSSGREDILCRQWIKTRKPVILHNFTGWTSPFDYANEIVHLLNQYSEFEIVDLGKIVAHRVYDLLGLYDRAVGVLTSDTMTLHLAAASPTPYIAFVRGDGQSGSIPKGNCVLQIKYHDTPKMLHAIDLQMQFWVKSIGK